MISITVSASKEYTVHIGDGLLNSVGQMTASVIKGRTALIISDENVWPIYGDAVAKSLQNANFIVYNFNIFPGEKSKNTHTYLEIINYLAETHLTRNDCIIALGGGVVGDMAGFAASTYLRGIPYIQVPTTLLAMVDSSVGGKTAIDLPAGKNLLGTFYQPTMVLCDPATLNTLPDSIFYDGCAEVIKYGILFDAQLFAHLEDKGTTFDREMVIAKCVEWKRAVVEQDEYDTGNRQLLNLGHTIGHSIEKESNYTISHGSAVSIGMNMICKSAVAENFCSKEDHIRIENLLTKFHLPISTEFAASTLTRTILSDKKRCNDQITLIIPATIGCCMLKKWPIQQLESLLKEGM